MRSPPSQQPLARGDGMGAEQVMSLIDPASQLAEQEQPPAGEERVDPQGLYHTPHAPCCCRDHDPAPTIGARGVDHAQREQSRATPGPSASTFGAIRPPAHAYARAGHRIPQLRPAERVAPTSRAPRARASLALLLRHVHPAPVHCRASSTTRLVLGTRLGQLSISLMNWSRW
jgi:hypothetical protein